MNEEGEGDQGTERRRVGQNEKLSGNRFPGEKVPPGHNAANTKLKTTGDTRDRKGTGVA